MKIATVKGTRDVLPKDKILKNKIVETLQETFEEFGFSPLETPILEKYDILSSKYTGGDEILKETYKLTDQGKRKLGLRYDLTVSLARFIAMTPNIKLPFKRYQIGRVFRDGPIKLGRYREFWQCDCDIIGSNEILADSECLNLLKTGFKKLKIPVEIQVNNRKILDSLMKLAGIKSNDAANAILSVDKLDKIGKQGVMKELMTKGFNNKQSTKLLDLLDFKGTNSQKVKYLEKIIPACEGVKEIKTLLSLVKGIRFDLNLARGLSYYTGSVFEVFAKTTIKSSLAGGGRYDKMIGSLVNKDISAVGISFGLEPIMEFLKTKRTIEIKTPVQVYIVPIKTVKESFEFANKLRSEGIKTDIDLNNRSITKNLNFANSYNIPFVVLLGTNELKKNKYTLRDMNSGKELLLSLNNLIKTLKKS